MLFRCRISANLLPIIGYKSVLAGPPFGDREFRLAQFHCHWGSNNQCGSEHQINGQSYSAEVSKSMRFETCQKDTPDDRDVADSVSFQNRFTLSTGIALIFLAFRRLQRTVTG